MCVVVSITHKIIKDRVLLFIIEQTTSHKVRFLLSDVQTCPTWNELLLDSKVLGDPRDLSLIFFYVWEKGFFLVLLSYHSTSVLNSFSITNVSTIKNKSHYESLLSTYQSPHTLMGLKTPYTSLCVIL